MNKVRYAIYLLLLFSVYYITARLGLDFYAVNRFATLVWPPTGIALAALFLLGYSLWPAITLGAFLVNKEIGASFLEALAMSVGNTLEAVLGVYLLNRSGFQPCLQKTQDVLKLIFYAAILSTLISGITGVTSLWVGQYIYGGTNLSGTFVAWWLGDVMGDLIIAPLLIVWGNLSLTKQVLKIYSKRYLEFLILVFSIIILCAGIFEGLPFPRFFHTDHPYFIFPLIIWAAMRFGPHGSVLIIFFVSFIAIWGTAGGTGPFIRETVSESLIRTQVFMAMVAITSMILSASIAERENQKQRLAILALESIKQRDRILASAQSLNAQYGTMKVLMSAKSIEEAALSLLSVIGVNLGWDIGEFWMVDKNQQFIQIIKVWQSPHVETREFLKESQKQKFAKGQGYPGKIWSSGRVLWREDISRDSSFIRRDVAQHENIYGIFGFPIFSENRILGVIEFFCKEIRPPEQELLHTAASIGGLIGQFIERRRAEEALQRSHAELEEKVFKRTEDLAKSRNIRDEFAAIVSHDLRNLLTGILSGANLIRKMEWIRDDRGKRQLELMELAVHNMNQMIKNLLDAYRSEMGGYKTMVEQSREICEVSSIVSEAIQLQNSIANEKKITLKMEIPKNLPQINVNSGLIGQVFQNLLGNSIKFTQIGGQIKVSAKYKNDQIIFSVQDNGPGIEKSLLPYLFDRFAQAKKTAQYGTGLGLVIVKGIIEAHGGKIWVESKVGVGTTFSFSIPVMKMPFTKIASK